MKILTGVSKAANSYWRAGIASGLVVFDVAVLCLCAIDSIRFANRGLSLVAAFSASLKAALDGKSVAVGFAVMAFFVIALPTLVTLLSMISPIERWPRFLRGRGKGILATHILLSGIVAMFTMTGITMEVLSGFVKGETTRYSFVSAWVGIVFLGKPVYIFYISPIIRKFLVRLSAGHAKITEVIEEVVTEEKMGSE